MNRPYIKEVMIKEVYGPRIISWVHDALLGNIDGNYAYWRAHPEPTLPEPQLHAGLLRGFLEARSCVRGWRDLSRSKRQAYVNAALATLVNEGRLQWWLADIGNGQRQDCYRPCYRPTPDGRVE